MEINLSQCNDYVDLLKAIYDKKKQNNPSYSLRSFAKKLQISPSNLSEILKKKHGISIKLGKKIAANLGEGEKISNFFENMVTYSNEKDEDKKNNLRFAINNEKYSNKTTQVEEDKYECIANWYHLVILEHIKNRGSIDINDIGPISTKFGVSEEMVFHSIQTLKRVGLLEKRNTQFFPTKTNTDFTSSSETIQKNHIQYLNLAKEAVTNQDFTERKFTSSILSIKPEDLPKAFRIINEMHMRLHLEIDSPGPGSKVYNYITGLFSLELDTLKNFNNANTSDS